MLGGGGYKSWVEEGSDRGEEEGQRGVSQGGGGGSAREEEGRKGGEEEGAAEVGRSSAHALYSRALELPSTSRD